MVDPKNPQESTNVPRGQTIWECPSCTRRYLTETPPAKCPYCLKPVQ